MSILKVNSIEPANAGSEDYAVARVWSAQFYDGGAGLSDFNVSSYVDLGTDVQVNFSNALTGIDHAVVVNAHRLGTLGTMARFGMASDSTSSSVVCACWTNGGATSAVSMSLCVFGDLA